MDIYLDIETIPTQRPEVRERLRDEVRPPTNYKKPESIDKWMSEHLEEEADHAWRRTAFDGGYGELACIGWGTAEMCDEGNVSVIARPDVSEAEMLATFYALVLAVLHDAHGRVPTFVGHNIGFDLRFLHHRSVVLGIKPPFDLSHNAAPWHGRYLDTMMEWCGARDRIKLVTLCDVLGIAVNDEIDGAGVWDAYQAERYDQIVSHCESDVLRVRQIVRKMRFQ